MINFYPDYKSKFNLNVKQGLPVSAAACVILPRGEYFTSKDAGAFTVWDTASIVYIIKNSAWKWEKEQNGLLRRTEWCVENTSKKSTNYCCLILWYFSELWSLMVKTGRN